MRKPHLHDSNKFHILRRERMSNILNIAVEFIASTTRWSTQGQRNSFMMGGTVWYGIMCRSFLLLERLLRSCLIELTLVSEQVVAEAQRRRGFGKPLDLLTLGQCLGVLQDVADRQVELISHLPPQVQCDCELLSQKDRDAWRRILLLRNQMVHHGPGFLDSVDLFSGRIWREYEIREPLEKQAEDTWALGRAMCRSPAVLMCMALQGVPPVTAREFLDRAEQTTFTLKEISQLGIEAINEFHASAGDSEAADHR